MAPSSFFLDNVYAIGKDHVKHITEESPMVPSSKKGEIRAEVDRLVLGHVERNGLGAIIARSPDFFGGTSKERSIGMKLVYDRLAKGKKAQGLCDAQKIHTMGYVPDLSKGTAMLGNSPGSYSGIWNLPTDPQQITGEGWIGLFAEVLGTDNRYTVLPQWLIKSLGLFMPIMRELAEMNYQYDRDYFFDSSKFNNHFDFGPTPPCRCRGTGHNTVQGDTIKLHGVEIFYREAGEPRNPTPVLLHGFPTSSLMFKNLMVALCGKFQLGAPDYPGFGYSDFPPARDFEYSIDNIGSHTDRFALTPKLESLSMYLHDYGNYIGAGNCLGHPDKMASIIVQNGHNYEEGPGPVWVAAKG